MLQNLRVHNFRCFKNFTLEKIAKINIIAAKNNVGKTTLLESIFLLLAYNNPDLLIKANMLRGVLLTSFSPDTTWEHFFYSKNVDDSLVISSKKDGKNITVTFEKDETFSLKETTIPAKEEFRPMPDGYPLKITFSYGEKTQSCHITPLQNGITTSWHSSPKNDLPIVQYVGPSSVQDQNLIRDFGKLEKSGKKESLIKIFQKLDNELEDISTIMEEIPRLYAKKSSGLVLPFSVMGNGLCKLMRILVAMLEFPNSILLVDEIETGFHHNFLLTLWEIIEGISIENNIQIFATTHSLECIQAASKAIKNKSDIMYVRLGKNTHGIQPYIFTGTELEYSFEQDMEIR